MQRTIHEAAKLLGISPDAIRLYEKEGLVTPIRDAHNGYRYYDIAQMHRIMGILLYRKLNISIAEIRKIFNCSSFSDISDKFSEFIESTEQEIEELKAKQEKMRFMQNHIQTLDRGYGTYSLQDLPECYAILRHSSAKPIYQKLVPIISSPIFSFGNFCYTLDLDEENHFADCRPNALEFLVRKPMMEISPYHEMADSFSLIQSCPCIYTVASSGELDEPRWSLNGLLDYAREQHLHCASYAYAFYVYSLMQDSSILDFYEIYVPIV